MPEARTGTDGDAGTVEPASEAPTALEVEARAFGVETSDAGTDDAEPEAAEPDVVGTGVAMPAEAGIDDAEPEAADDADGGTSWEPDAGALAAYAELGRSALHEITPAATVGAPVGHLVEGDRVVTLYFAVTRPGYTGWRWTASIAHVEGADATVLEVEMTPGDGALLAPDWVPWVDRLADYRAAQDAAAADAEAAEAAALENDDDLDDSDDDESDDEDDDSPIRPVLHSGDVDGVDIDDLDESDDDDDAAVEEDSDGDDGDAGGSDADEGDADDDRGHSDDGDARAAGDAGLIEAVLDADSSAPAAGDVEESEQSEQEPDTAGGEHPSAARSDQRTGEEQ